MHLGIGCGLYSRPDEDVIQIVDSIDDKSLIVKLAGYLDEDKQVEGLSEALAYVYRNKYKQEPEEGTEEREFIEGGEILEEKKRIIHDRKRQKKVEKKDRQTIRELESFREKKYEGMPSWEIAQKISKLSTDEKKISAMKTFFEEISAKQRYDADNDHDYSSIMRNEFDSIAIVASSMDSDESIKFMMEEYMEKTFEYYQEKFASSGISMSEYADVYSYEKCKYRSIMSLYDKTAEMEKLKQSGKYDEYIDFAKTAFKEELALSGATIANIAERGIALETDEDKEHFLKTGDAYKLAITNDDADSSRRAMLRQCSDIICSIESDEEKVRVFNEVLKPLKDHYAHYIEKNEDSESLEELEEVFNHELLCVINSIKDKSKMIDTYAEYGILDVYLNSRFSDKGEVVQDNIEKILGYKEIDDIQAKKEMLERMSKNNSRLYELIDFRLLDDRYISVFSENEINLILYNPMFIDKCCEYSDKQLEFIASIIKDIDEDDFGEVIHYATSAFNTYRELVSNIDFDLLTEEQKNRLKTLIQYKNIFDIKTIDDIDNFETIKEAKLKEIMNREINKDNSEAALVDKKNALLLKMYGMDYETVCIFTKEFKELVPDDPKLQMMNYIIELDIEGTEAHETDKLLRSMFEDERIKGKQVSLVDKISARKEYITKFEKKYNDVLYRPEDGTFIEERDGIKFYDMGTDFSVLTTSVGVYKEKRNLQKETNEQAMWNRNDLSSNHFCGSFSTDAMIGMIMTDLGVYYGFSSVEPGSMIYMDMQDTQSISSSLSSSENGTRSFLFPDAMADSTGKLANLRQDLYNEIDVKRRTKNVIKEPDYIIAIKVDGKIINEEAAIKAARDWGGKKTVQVMDVDKCFAKSKETLNKAVDEYRKNPTKENLQKVWNVFHKTSVTYGVFYSNRGYPPFMEMVELPEELKKNINCDYNVYYSLKDDRKLMPRKKEMSQEELRSGIGTLMDSIYGSKKDRYAIEKKGEKTQTAKGTEQSEFRLTFEEIGKDTLQTFKKYPRKEMAISKMIKGAISKIQEMLNDK